MDLPLTVKNIIKESEYRMKEKGSLFIGTAIPVSCEEEAINKLSLIQKKYYDATHNCYAYLLQSGKLKYSDDGEPNGTAGIRIFNSINHFALTDLVLIVTRYFGGTKLGVGPLGKAYSDCSQKTLEKSEIITKKLYRSLIIRYPFDYSNLVHRILIKYKAKINTNDFDPFPLIKANIPEEDVKIFYEEIHSNSNAKVEIEITNDILYI